MNEPTILRVENTLSRQKEEFIPMHEGKVKFFVCGPTVYDFPHLGHAKTYIQFDFIVRYLRQKGYDVFYLQNITDIDNKILDRARELGISWKQLAEKYEAIYYEDMAALGNNAVTEFARATDYVPQIVEQVKVLLEKGYTYYTDDGSIYYELSKFPSYGKLAGCGAGETESAQTRLDQEEIASKRDKNDFCLWKARKGDDPYWPTELGEGRPGWHIEDTAITETFFGAQYDAHGGALDLIHPHHEAEIAQMEAKSGLEPLVRYWLHTGFLNVNGEKMSKSKGNFVTIRDALAKMDRKVLRFMFIRTHYRSGLDFTDTLVEDAKASLRRLNEFTFKIDPTYDDSNSREAVEQLRNKVYAELDDDFGTPRAFAAIFDFIREQNRTGSQPGRLVFDQFQEFDRLFGIFEFEAASFDEETVRYIERLLQERETHKSMGKWSEADAIRNQLSEMGVEVRDNPGGHPTWKRAN